MFYSVVLKQRNMFLKTSVLKQGHVSNAIVKKNIVTIGSWPSDHYFCSVCWFVCLPVCLFVCLCRVFLSHLWSDFDKTRTYVICLDLVCPLEYRGCATPGAGWPLKTCIFRGFGAQKTISSYSFDRIVLIFGYIVECTNTKILSSHFFAISILNPNYVVINDIISSFAKVVV